MISAIDWLKFWQNVGNIADILVNNQNMVKMSSLWNM